MKFLLNILNYLVQQLNYSFSLIQKLIPNTISQIVTYSTTLIFIFILISKEFIILNEEILVVISFFLFVYFLYSKISSMIYFELFVRDDKLSRELDINAFLHQEILQTVLNLDKLEIATSDIIINEQNFLINTFLPVSKITKTLAYIKHNLNSIKSNLLFLNHVKQKIYQDLETQIYLKINNTIKFYTYFYLYK